MIWTCRHLLYKWPRNGNAGINFTVTALLVMTWDQGSHIVGWPWRHFVEGDDIELLTLLPPPPKSWMTGMHHVTGLCCFGISGKITVQTARRQFCECQPLFLPDVRTAQIWAAVLYSMARIRSSRAVTLSQNSPEIVQKALGWGKSVCLLSSWPLEFLHKFDSNYSEIKHSSQ